MKLKMIAMAFFLTSCGKLMTDKQADQGSNTAAYAYGDCGQNRIFATYYTGSNLACVYTRPADNCHAEANDLESVNVFAIPTDALQRGLNQSVGPNAFIDLENEDVMATVGVETIRGIKSTVKRLEQDTLSKFIELEKKKAWERCTDNGRRPYSDEVQQCIKDLTSRSGQSIPRC